MQRYLHLWRSRPRNGTVPLENSQISEPTRIILPRQFHEGKQDIFWERNSDGSGLGRPAFAVKAKAAKLARLVYNMLRHGMEYVDRGTEFTNSKSACMPSPRMPRSSDSNWSRWFPSATQNTGAGCRSSRLGRGTEDQALAFPLCSSPLLQAPHSFKSEKRLAKSPMPWRFPCPLCLSGEFIRSLAENCAQLLFHLRGTDARNPNQLLTAEFSGGYRNRRAWNIQKFRDEIDARLVGAAFDGRRGQRQLERVAQHAGDGVLAGARMHLDLACGSGRRVVDGYQGLARSQKMGSRQQPCEILR